MSLENLPERAEQSDRINSTTSADVAAIAAKGALGLIPIVGPIVAEIVSAIIPGQRQARIGKFLESVSQKIEHLEEEVVKQKMATSESVDLIEECFMGAARALSPDRIEYLANLYVEGITVENVEHEQNMKMASILAQLSDAEVIWLGHLAQFRAIGDSIDKHQDILSLRGVTRHDGVKKRDQMHLQKAWISHLVQLGLAEEKLEIDMKTKQPVMDTFSKEWKRSHTEVTWLGRMLLGYIGIYEPIRHGDPIIIGKKSKKRDKIIAESINDSDTSL